MYSDNPEEENNNRQKDKIVDRFIFELDEAGKLIIKKEGKILNTFDIRGPKGIAGSKGDTGPKGDQGERGIQGAAGPVGLDGDTWIPIISEDGKFLSFENSQGAKTSQYRIQGEQGLKGEKGDTGKQGPQGVSGKDGDTWIPHITDNGKHLYFQNKNGQITEKYPFVGPAGENGESAYITWQKSQPNPSECTLEKFWDYLKGRDGKNGVDGDSAFEIWKKNHREEGKEKTEEDFFDDIAARVKTQEGATYIPEFLPDGRLYFKNSKTGNTTTPHTIKGTDGKVFQPCFDEKGRLYFVDKNGVPQTKFYEIKGEKGDTGKDGRTFKPNKKGTTLYFESEDGEKSETWDLHGKDAFELWKEKHHKPDAAFEEYEEFFKGAHIKSQYNYEDIKDSEIPIQKINRNLITDSDYTDGMGIEEYYRYRQKCIEEIRKQGRTMRGNWFQEMFWWCAGVDTSVLRTCPADYSKYVGIGTVIFFTALMAFFSCFMAMQLVFGEYSDKYTFPIGGVTIIPILIIAIIFLCGYRTDSKKTVIKNTFAQKQSDKTNDLIDKKSNNKIFYVCTAIIVQSILLTCDCLPKISVTNGIASIIATFWAMMIFFLDRFITNTMYSDGKSTISWGEFCSALPRIIISVFLGIIISIPLELKIFNSEIKKYIITNETNNNDVYKNLTSEKNQFDNSIKHQISDFKKIYIPDRNAYTKKIEINIPSTSANRVIGSDADGNLIYSNPSNDRKAKKDSIIADPVAYQAAVNEYINKISLLKDSLNKYSNKLANDIVKQQVSIRDSVTDIYNKGGYGLYEHLTAMHFIAMENYKEWHLESFHKIFIGVGIFLLILIIFLKKWWRKIEKDSKAENTTYNWWNLTYILPIACIIAVICAINSDTLFHYIPSYCFSAIGVIMLLFILIDISPVFYRMMLADGKYEKIIHQDKLLEQDLIRLQVAKTIYKLNESELSNLSPFVLGSTFEKFYNILNTKKENNTKKKLFDFYEPDDGQKKEIKKVNDKLFKEILNMKYRIIWGAYSAWYRNMYDVMLGKKDNMDGDYFNPYNVINKNINEDTDELK